MRTPVLIILLSVLLAACYAVHLDFPAKEYYDEVYHVKAAREFMTLSANSETSHPPFGKTLIALSICIFGDKPWAWRFVSLVSALGVALLFFTLARKFLKSAGWAFAAVLLFALDGIALTQARIAMLNSLMLLWMFLTLWFFVKVIESSGKSRRALLGCGLALGLTAATRWVGLGVLAVMGLLLAKDFENIKIRKDAERNLLVYFLLLPLFVYFSTHFILLFIKGYGWPEIMKYQYNMLHYHSTLKAGHGYGSEFWSWPFMGRPIWYFFERSGGLVMGIACIGNPAVVWMGIPVLVYLGWDYFKNRDAKSGFVVAGFLSQWLPWALIGRVKFFHYFYPAMPFVALAITMFFRQIWENGGMTGKILTIGYGLLAIGMFIYWYPLWTGLAVSEAYFQNHLWFRSWI